MAATKMRDPALRRARALMILQGRIHAKSLADLAAEFNVSEQQIAREIDWAKRQGLVQNFEDEILGDLVPEAIKAFKAALQNGDTQVALEVLKGTGLLRKPTDKPLTQPAAVEDSLEIHIKRIRGAAPTGANAQLSSVPSLALSEASSAHVSDFLEGALVVGEPQTP